MNLSEFTIQGTLKPDGTLELDQTPDLLPGRVKVIVQPSAEPPPNQEGWWPYMQRIRAEREAAGYHFMDEVEMQAHIEWLREDEPQS